MHFAVTCLDKPGHAHVRAETRPAHVAFLKANAEKFPIAGPFVSDDGASMTGSLLIVEIEDRAALDALLAEDPYAKAGLFETVEIRPWKWTIGAPA
ncbi:YciI family protein [Methylobrevis pamukkalensis]|uniref:YciI-like protein n=1 Tax=Methylobrevis pamukkalensis TaxID=1439726 RepID=A0A1E3H263_9HYPH|nr:YciI family protein [Methylobrevis pamukkalensis]ODN70407.1 YciI-like protein [Methylobrevis pamukkalensis]